MYFSKHLYSIIMTSREEESLLYLNADEIDFLKANDVSFQKKGDRCLVSIRQLQDKFCSH